MKAVLRWLLPRRYVVRVVFSQHYRYLWQCWVWDRFNGMVAAYDGMDNDDAKQHAEKLENERWAK